MKSHIKHAINLMENPIIICIKFGPARIPQDDCNFERFPLIWKMGSNDIFTGVTYEDLARLNLKLKKI